VTFKSLHGESSSVDLPTVANWLPSLRDVLSSYEPREIYNADETGIFWRMMPDKTLAFKGEKCSGGKKSKERLTGGSNS
jgi:hypothetical protein